MQKIKVFIQTLETLATKFPTESTSAFDILRCLIFLEIAKNNGSINDGVSTSRLIEYTKANDRTITDHLQALSNQKLVHSIPGKNENIHYITQKGQKLKKAISKNIDICKLSNQLIAATMVTPTQRINRFEDLIFFLNHFINDNIYQYFEDKASKRKNRILKNLSKSFIKKDSDNTYRLTINGKNLQERTRSIINGNLLNKIPSVIKRRIHTQEGERIIIFAINNKKYAFISKLLSLQNQTIFQGISKDHNRIKIYSSKKALKKHLKKTLKAWKNGTLDDDNMNFINTTIFEKSKLFNIPLY